MLLDCTQRKLHKVSDHESTPHLVQVFIPTYRVLAGTADTHRCHEYGQIPNDDTENIQLLEENNISALYFKFITNKAGGISGL